MNYSEEYELQERQGHGLGWVTVGGPFDRETEAVRAMEQRAAGESGAWRVVRLSMVTVAAQSKA